MMRAFALTLVLAATAVTSFSPRTTLVPGAARVQRRHGATRVPPTAMMPDGNLPMSGEDLSQMFKGTGPFLKDAKDFFISFQQHTHKTNPFGLGVYGFGLAIVIGTDNN